ncbi:hypothetical protein PR202_ga13638 [Eleusine coracana subsp. coracana]|uniref:Uncharacterized protein n=1 Tax=Eleusine coracana subsp. coracana TaxID=191504 RepID=A0AAV5CEL6_ELECO|nr:hypothetical protein PR202_ga13638 [Eleusine coracana subsp. coracana]
MFTCKFGCRSNSDLRRQDSGGSGKERKGWSVTVHDLSGSPVALASMVTPFVASPGTDRVSRSNPGAWLIMRPAGDGAWEPWARLECWRERGGAGSADSLGYHFDLLVPGVDHAVPLAESSIPASKGGKFAIDLTASAQQPLSRGGTPGCRPRGSGDFTNWPLGNYRGFVMSAAVQGEGKCSKPTVEVGGRVAHRVRGGRRRVRRLGSGGGPEHGRVQALLAPAEEGALALPVRPAPVTFTSSPVPRSTVTIRLEQIVQKVVEASLLE